eukprot:scaffold1330_cov240-Pinguiococcus_pyrenoidosus.AAC.31
MRRPSGVKAHPVMPCLCPTKWRITSRLCTSTQRRMWSSQGSASILESAKSSAARAGDGRS